MENFDAPQLAYYSSMGPLDAMDAASVARRSSVRTVLIAVHGSGRNADDYLACAVASTPKQQRDSTLVLAPRFLAPGDGLVNATNSSIKLLRWAETYPIPHTWRYGADAIRTGISSFQAMDVLVEQLNRTTFPLLEEIVVAGHSAGGQFTQRWALTSGSAAWGDKHDSASARIRLSAVAANPRSFCYLDGRRFLNGTLQLPSNAATEACPGYDSWEWGLAPGHALKTPYKDRALAEAGGPEHMAVRYSLRNVLYIAGEFDVLKVHDSCEDDDFQGLNRRQRSMFFFESLSEIYPLHFHRRFIAPNTPHDHCLIFQSDPFQKEVFGRGAKTGRQQVWDNLR
jgi:pimeloyl-ACP methyl ester carboxylesterase